MCVKHLNNLNQVKKNKTELAGICHHTLKCQCKAIMHIRKMQALRNEMPGQKSQDGFQGVFLPHESAR